MKAIKFGIMVRLTLWSVWSVVHASKCSSCSSTLKDNLAVKPTAQRGQHVKGNTCSTRRLTKDCHVIWITTKPIDKKNILIDHSFFKQKKSNKRSSANKGGSKEISQWKGR